MCHANGVDFREIYIDKSHIIAGEWGKDGYSRFRNTLGDFPFAMGFSSDSQGVVFMSGGPTYTELDKRFLACLASYAPPDRQAEVHG